MAVGLASPLPPARSPAQCWISGKDSGQRAAVTQPPPVSRSPCKPGHSQMTPDDPSAADPQHRGQVSSAQQPPACGHVEGAVFVPPTRAGGWSVEGPPPPLPWGLEPLAACPVVTHWLLQLWPRLQLGEPLAWGPRTRSGAAPRAAPCAGLGQSPEPPASRSRPCWELAAPPGWIALNRSPDPVQLPSISCVLALHSPNHKSPGTRLGGWVAEPLPGRPGAHGRLSPCIRPISTVNGACAGWFPHRDPALAN